jgi:5,10-methylenetetrahydromethanopterin reductase
MRVDLRVPVGLPVPDTVEFIRRCEDAGFHGVGVHDHPHAGREVYVTLALAASRTSHLVLYSATSNPVIRHPMVMAALANSLGELAPGRVAVSLAPGYLAVRSVGRGRASVEDVRQAVLAIRGLLAGESVSMGAGEARMRNAVSPPTPVYVLAAGPRMVELAGEVGDGALVMAGVHPRAVAAARERLAAGAARAGRDLDAFPVIWVVPLGLADDLETARRWPRVELAGGLSWITYPSSSNLHWLRQAGLEIPDKPRARDISEELAARICDAFGLFGTAEQCLEQLQGMREQAGIEHVWLTANHTTDQSYEMPTRELEAFGKVVLPRL